MKVDFLIIGQGLAGSLLAWQLLKRGKRVLVVDRDEPVTSSKVAAGIVTPITGDRIAPSWRVNDMLPFAHKFYWEVEEELNQSFFFHTRIARLFRNEKQQQRWKKIQTEQPEIVSSFVSKEPFEINHERFYAELGGFEMSQSGWLDVPGFLLATQLHLLERLGYAIGRFDHRDLQISDSEVTWKNITAEAVVFAQGWEGTENPYFASLPMNATKGEILDLEITEVDRFPETRIVNRGGWVLPLGDGKFRAGSNYDHDFADDSPTTEGKAAVLEKVSKIMKPAVSVTGHKAAIRPIIRQSRAVIGRHPEVGNVAIFNGLGSKGVMNGPFVADQLADHLVNNTPIDDDLDVRKLL